MIDPSSVADDQRVAHDHPKHDAAKQQLPGDQSCPDPVHPIAQECRDDAGRHAQDKDVRDQAEPRADLKQAQAIHPQVIKNPSDYSEPDRRIIEHVGDDVEALQIPESNPP